MTYISKVNTRHEGRKRIHYGFLFFPKTIHGETRWLEKAIWSQEGFYGAVSGNKYWLDTNWIDEV